MEKRHPAIQERGVLKTGTQGSTQGGWPWPPRGTRTRAQTPAKVDPAQPRTASWYHQHRTPSHGAPGSCELYLQERKWAPTENGEKCPWVSSRGRERKHFEAPRVFCSPQACAQGKLLGSIRAGRGGGGETELRPRHTALAEDRPTWAAAYPAPHASPPHHSTSVDCSAFAFSPH